MIKVAELKGIELDYWVARAHGMEVIQWSSKKSKPKSDFRAYPGDSVPKVSVSDFRPSSSWAWGGPIIESEGIDITVACESVDGPKHIVFWSAERDDWDRPALAQKPLVAAMRGYVANHFGQEFEP